MKFLAMYIRGGFNIITYVKMNFLPIVKYGGGLLGLWGWFASFGHGAVIEVSGIKNSSKCQESSVKNLENQVKGAPSIFSNVHFSCYSCKERVQKVLKKILRYNICDNFI